jgi:hypothetical protein
VADYLVLATFAVLGALATFTWLVLWTVVAAIAGAATIIAAAAMGISERIFMKPTPVFAGATIAPDAQRYGRHHPTNV